MDRVTYKNYIPQLKEEFPDVDTKSLQAIVRHGLAILTVFRLNDHDILLNNNGEKLYYYVGQISNDEAKRDEISRKKIRKKLRLVKVLAKQEYNGYYYFGLTQDEYELHLEGKPIPKVLLYKLEAEARLYRKAKHFFQIKMEDMRKWCIGKEDYETSNAEYIQ